MKLFMYSKIIISILFVAAILLALFHDLAIRLSWYYFYPLIDIPLHILGGFVIGLFTHIAVRTTKKRPKRRSSPTALLAVMILTTFFISLGWEVFELVFYLTNDAGLSLETLSDIIFGIVGAMFAWVVVRLLANFYKE